MAGYSGFSMSNNAVAAYSKGEKPLSKWTKVEILDGLVEVCSEDKTLTFWSMVKTLSLSQLKKHCLSNSSWHHSSKFFNKIDFYTPIDLADVDIEMFECWKNVKSEDMANIKHPDKLVRNCQYIIWSGSRNHPKANIKTAQCEVIGNWAITPDGRKSIMANGFKFI